MAERDWGHISSGATFEALLHTLLRSEDPKASLFAREGKDGGQDALSGDGRMVYQAKHHVDGSAAKTIADALKEAKKIGAYQKGSDRRATTWKGVTHWRLVSNATFNANDRQRWVDEVMPAFKAIGLVADFWLRPELDALLAKHPDVRRAFFEQEARAFLTLPELKERFELEAPFLSREQLPPFVGRDSENSEVAAFLSSNALFLVVHGPGGVGKSRFLLEVGERLVGGDEWQVLSANVATLSAGTSWFDGVVPERPTVLLVDEPDTDQVLRLLAEQLGGSGGRTTKWKVIVAARSPKDAVLRFLSSPKMKARVRWLPLEELTNEAAQQMCRDLLASGPLAAQAANLREHAIKTLAERFARQPIWLTLAVHLLETYNDINQLPKTASELADLYLEEIVEQQNGTDPDVLRTCLRWVALIGTVNRESDQTIELIANQVESDPTSLRGLLSRLVERRALAQRGANGRLVELKPDVLRDHILSTWLVEKIGYGPSPYVPSHDATVLLAPISNAIKQGGLSDVGRAILTSVGRTELLFRNSETPVALLDPFFADMNTAVPLLSASSRIALTEVLPEIAPLRVLDSVKLVTHMRASVAPNETVNTMYGRRDLTNDDVLLHLAWPVYHAAMGADTQPERTTVLNTLYELAIAEAEAIPRLPRKELPNDGRRAGALLGQAIGGGRYFRTSFEDAVSEIGHTRLEDLRKSPPTVAETQALKALLTPALAVERHEDWMEGDQFIFQKYVITAAHPAWAARERLVQQIRAILLDDTAPLESHVVLWQLLVEGHRLANYVAINRKDDVAKAIREGFVSELRWMRDALKRRGPRFEEMRAARDLWDWHARFEEEPEIKAAADELEDLYRQNELAAEFEPILEFESVESYDRKASEASLRILGAGTNGIGDFVDRAARFVKDDRRFSALNGVAAQLGRLAEGNEVVREFAARTLQQSKTPHHLEFALAIARSWCFNARRDRGAQRAFEVLRELAAICGDDSTRIRLLCEVYGLAPPLYKTEQLFEDELRFLRDQVELFARRHELPSFIGLVAPTFIYDVPAYKSLVEHTLAQLSEPALTSGVAWLIQGVFWAIYKRDDLQLPERFNEWLFEQILRVADIDAMGSMTDHRLDEIVKSMGPLPLHWLPKALSARAKMEAAAGGSGNVRALGFDSAFGQYVEPVREEPTSTEVSALNDLLDLVDDPGTVGFRLADVLHDVDPNGTVLSGLIAARIREGNLEHARRFMRLAQSYVVNTAPWRTIALAAIEVASKAGSSEMQGRVFSVISNPGMRSWSGRPGEVPSIFVDAVETAKRYRDDEADPRFAVFWTWYIERAEAELKWQAERAKEERGE